jgi:hypothetical protein
VIFLKTKRNFFVWIFVFLCISGCMAMESDLVKDMDSVYKSLLNDSGKSNKSEEMMSSVARDYFLIGSDYHLAIVYLSESGFEIYEYTEDGVRKLPDKQITPYGNDVSFKRGAIGSLKGDKRVYAKKDIYLDFWYFFKNPFGYFMVKKEAVVILDFSKEKILDVKANMWVTGV